ncbi:MAG: hypothetical protein QM479_06515 [Pseudomonadota bacterium]
MTELPSHGILFQYSNTGVLLTGASGIGKSDIMLQLLQTNAKLVCDDGPSYKIKKVQGKKILVGYCADTELAEMMHIRDLGLIHVPSLFGKNSVQKQVKIELIIHLDTDKRLQQSYQTAILAPEYSILSYQQFNLSVLKLAYNSNRPMALLVKLAVKQFKLKQLKLDPCQVVIK